MLRHSTNDDERPRRHLGARVVAIKAEQERGLVMRMLFRNPKDMVAGLLAFAAVSAIIVNALLLQAGRHPAPMFGSVVMMPAVESANPLPRARLVEADVSMLDVNPAKPKSAERAEEPKPADPLGNLVKATSAVSVTASNVLRAPASIPATSRSEAISSSGARRVAAVQRALTEYGYGLLKPTGTVGADTQAAILKFERTRKMPVTGQMSDRLVRELTAMIGHPID